ncbi:MAG: MBL fold metallo-hydrolase [Desulfomonilia bacterium]|jgi:hydroxyacylglutathione hydrolase
MLNVSQIACDAFALLSYVLTETGSGESLIVDPPADLGERIDLGSLKIRAVVNTHLHPDHTMGNHLFAGTAPILAHPGDSGFFMRLASSSLSALFTARIPPKISFTLEEGSSLELGDACIRVMHTPGHSCGSICLYWPGNLITGDTIFVEGIGRTDIPGGSTEAIRESIRRILDLPDDTRIWPGHSYGGHLTATLGQIRASLGQVVEMLR